MASRRLPLLVTERQGPRLSALLVPLPTTTLHQPTRRGASGPLRALSQRGTNDKHPSHAQVSICIDDLKLLR
jgi:hypothetical protein